MDGSTWKINLQDCVRMLPEASLASGVTGNLTSMYWANIDGGRPKPIDSLVSFTSMRLGISIHPVSGLDIR